jgi:hypothetical protein
MNTTKNFNQLTAYARLMMDSALDALNDETYGVGTLAKNPEQIAYHLSWRAEAWMKASAQLGYGQLIAQMLEHALLECYTENDIDGEGFNEALDRRAATICREIGRQCFTVIVRGEDRHNNRIDDMNESVKQKAARDILESLCGFSSWNLSHSAAFDDLMAGRERRAAESREAQAKVVVKIVYFKKERADGGHYRAHALNRDGSVIHALEWPCCTRKADALTRVAEWVKTFRDNGHMGPIRIEAA